MIPMKKEYRTVGFRREGYRLIALFLAALGFAGTVGASDMSMEISGNQVDLWLDQTEQGKTYLFQTSTNLTTDWQDLGDPVIGDGRFLAERDQIDNPSGFYRLLRTDNPVLQLGLQTDLQDHSGSGHVVTPVGGTVVFGEGRTDHYSAYIFDGGNALDVPTLGSMEALTLSTYVYLDDIVGATTMLYDSGTQPGGIQLYLRDNHAGTHTGDGKDRDVGLVFKVHGNAGGNGVTGESVESNYRRFAEHSLDFITTVNHERMNGKLNHLWLHLAVSYDPAQNSVDLYVNGRHDSTHTFSTAQPPVLNASRIGSDLANAQPLIGRVSDFTVYDTALSSEQIRALSDFRPELWAIRDIEQWTTDRTYYVDATAGNDSSDGSAGSPLKTLTEAIDRINALSAAEAPGSRVVLKPGMYREGGIHLKENGTRFKPIIIEAETPGTVTLSGSEVWDDDAWTQQPAQPGLWYGEVPGNINTTDPNPSTGTTTDLSETEDGIAPDTTEIYTGEIYDADGNISFTEDIDDKVRLYIDGTLVLNDDDWSTRTSTGNLNLQPGWHTFELRISNGSGGSGPYSLPGIGYDPDGGTDWIHPEDPGDGSLFRRYTPLWTHDWPYAFGRSTTAPVDHETEARFRRELVALDGTLLRPYTSLARLQDSTLDPDVYLSADHAFYVDELNDVIYVRTTKDPNTSLVEVGIHEKLLRLNVWFNNCDYVAIRGIRFQHTASFIGDEALDIVGSDHVLVEDCEMVDNGSVGLGSIDKGNGTVIRRCTFSRNGREGFSLTRGYSRAWVQDCVVEQNHWRNDLGNYSGPDLAGIGKIMFSSRIYLERVHVNDHSCPGIWADAQNWDITVDNCYLAGNGVGFFTEINTLNSEIINSACYYNRQGGAVIMDSESVRVENNMFKQSEIASYRGMLSSAHEFRDEQAHIPDIYAAKNSVVRNNIIATAGTSGNLHHFDSFNGVSSAMVSSGNTYYAPYTSNLFNIENTAVSFADWHAALNDTTSQLLPVSSPPFVNDGSLTVGFESDWALAPELLSALNVPIILSKAVDDTITLDVTVESLTAIEGDDFRVIGAGTVTFQPLERSRVVHVVILRDGVAEGEERFRLTLSNPTNASLGTETVFTVRIPANDV
ncbi:right-handed parallel beta-helix repeat-containing protein [Pontiellaceae bacterium B12227]|nr:right-handed parallel beta-helix repeat-containing protein [Pontiellaceae bacterium B12227]